MPKQIGSSNQKNTSKKTSALKSALSQQELMQRAVSLQTIAASYGFDWPNIAPVFEKLDEEIQELKYEVDLSASPESNSLDSHKRLEDELGDVLFCCMNLARFLNVDPAKALKSTNQKFERRFGFIESYVAEQGKEMQDLSLEELDKAWDLAKEKGL